MAEISKKFGQKNPRHVPDIYRDFQAQVRMILPRNSSSRMV